MLIFLVTFAFVFGKPNAHLSLEFEHLIKNTSGPRPNSACVGVQMSFQNFLGPSSEIKGWWLVHKASNSELREILWGSDLKDQETSERKAIDSGNLAYDYWSFAAIVKLPGATPILAYTKRQAVLCNVLNKTNQL
jgi:hypothetical protein